MFSPFKRFSLTLVFAAYLVGFSLPSAAATCKGDKKVDVPMQFSIAIQSAGRIHVSAFGGSDRSGPVSPATWRVYSASGTLIDYFPRTNLVFASSDMLKETNLEGLVPETSYTIELTSEDFCGRLATVRQSVTMPVATPESAPPAVSAPALALVGLQTGQFSQLQFSATDDTGIQSVSVSINGTPITEYDYFDGVSLRWWCDPYPADGVQSVLEGPYYYVNYPTKYKGQYALVEVVVVDIFGNRSTSSAQLLL